MQHETSKHNPPVPVKKKKVSYLAGISISTLPLFQYTLDCTHSNRTKVEKNRVIQTNIIKLDNGRTWISYTTSLGRKMAHYKAHFSHKLKDGFIIMPSYMDIHLPHVLYSVIGQLQTS